MSEDPLPVEAPDTYPMTLTEWSRLHRLLSIGNAKLAPIAVTHRPDGIYSENNELILQFSPPVKATIKPTSSVAPTPPVPGNITHACLSSAGLRLWFRANSATRSTSIGIRAVISVEQVL